MFSMVYSERCANSIRKKETWRIKNKINFIYPQKISMQYRLYSIWWGGEKAINEIVKLTTIVEKSPSTHDDLTRPINHAIFYKTIYVSF